MSCCAVLLTTQREAPPTTPPRPLSCMSQRGPCRYCVSNHPLGAATTRLHGNSHSESSCLYKKRDEDEIYLNVWSRLTTQHPLPSISGSPDWPAIFLQLLVTLGPLDAKATRQVQSALNGITRRPYLYSEEGAYSSSRIRTMLLDSPGGQSVDAKSQQGKPADLYHQVESVEEFDSSSSSSVDDAAGEDDPIETSGDENAGDSRAPRSVVFSPDRQGPRGMTTTRPRVFVPDTPEKESISAHSLAVSSEEYFDSSSMPRARRAYVPDSPEQAPVEGDEEQDDLGGERDSEWVAVRHSSTFPSQRFRSGYE